MPSATEALRQIEKTEPMALPSDSLFERLTTEFLTAQYAAHPVMATAMGVHDYDDRLDSFNRFAIRDDRDRVRAYLHGIDKISLADLSQQNRLNYRIARSEAQMTLSALERTRWPERQPGAYLDTLFQGCFLLIARDFTDRETRAWSLLRRLGALPDALLEARQNFKNPPRLSTEVAIERAVAGDTLFGETLPAFVATLPSPGLQQAILEASARARVGLSEFARFLRGQLLPRSEGDFALGRELFEYHLRVGHLLDQESCDTLLQCGEDLLLAAKRELAELAEQIAPGSGWESIVADLKAEHPSAEGLIDAYAREVEHAREFVLARHLMDLPGNETLALMETPGFARSLLPYVAYVPPAPFEARAQGMFWVTPISEKATREGQERQLQEHSCYQIPIVALHEAIPGHHLQGALASRVPSAIHRHFAHNSLFTEGWALYCEELMWEQGFYTDPRVRLMQLKAHLWRACRVLVDVRLHTRQLSLSDAARFLQTEAKLPPSHAWAEVKRIALHPTQPSTCVLGRRALLALRDEMQRRRGSRFDLRDFHNELLSYGGVPPALIRDAMTVVA